MYFSLWIFEMDNTEVGVSSRGNGILFPSKVLYCRWPDLWDWNRGHFPEFSLGTVDFPISIVNVFKKKEETKSETKCIFLYFTRDRSPTCGPWKCRQCRWSPCFKGERPGEKLEKEGPLEKVGCVSLLQHSSDGFTHLDFPVESGVLASILTTIFYSSWNKRKRLMLKLTLSVLSLIIYGSIAGENNTY